TARLLAVRLLAARLLARRRATRRALRGRLSRRSVASGTLESLGIEPLLLRHGGSLLSRAVEVAPERRPRTRDAPHPAGSAAASSAAARRSGLPLGSSGRAATRTTLSGF